MWEEIFSNSGWGRYPSEEAVRFFMRSKKILSIPHPRALDLGCGEGACSWFMAKEGARVTAMDGAPTGLRKTKELAATFGVQKKITTILGDITCPQRYLPAQPYDIILDHYALYANPKSTIEHALQKIHGLLKPSGLFLFCCFGSRSVNCGLGEKVNGGTMKKVNKDFECGESSFFTRSEVNRLLKKTGYRIEYSEDSIQKRKGTVIEKLVTCVRH
jgi:cyclopropane fatty-acyl-phospholipid synthase-like methyltransferase